MSLTLPDMLAAFWSSLTKDRTRTAAVTASRNLSNADSGKIIVVNPPTKNSVVTLTIPAGLATSFACEVRQGKQGRVIVAAANGVTFPFDVKKRTLQRERDRLSLRAVGLNKYTLGGHERPAYKQPSVWDAASAGAPAVISADGLTAQCVAGAASAFVKSVSTQNAGKVYAEITLSSSDTASNTAGCGVCLSSFDSRAAGADSNRFLGDSADAWAVYDYGSVVHDNNFGDPVAGYTLTGGAAYANAVIGIALDIDNGKGWFSVNGTSQGNPVAGTSPDFTFPAGSVLTLVVALTNPTVALSTSGKLNAGASAFAHAPNGFAAWAA